MQTVTVALSLVLLSALTVTTSGCSDEKQNGTAPPVVDRLREPARYGFVFDESSVKAAITARCQKSAPADTASCVDRIRKASAAEGVSVSIDEHGEPALRSYVLDAAGNETTSAEMKVKSGTTRTITWLDDRTFAVDDRGERFVYRRL